MPRKFPNRPRKSAPKVRSRLAARVALEKSPSAKHLTVSEKEYAAQVITGEAPLSAELVKKDPLLREAVIEGLAELGVDPKALAAGLKEGLAAMETKFFAEKGLVTDERDVISWGDRHRYMRTTLEVMGIIGQRVSQRMNVKNFNYTSRLRGKDEVIPVSEPNTEAGARRLAAHKAPRMSAP